jgi:hypothetical protein
MDNFEWEENKISERKDLVYFDLLDIVIYLIAGMIVGKIISLIMF